jgi:hypothetical protein
MKAIKFEGRRVEEIEIDNTLEALQAAEEFCDIPEDIKRRIKVRFP